MSNVNSISTYTSSTNKTTAVVQTFFGPHDVPNYQAVTAVATVTWAAETLMNPSGTAVALNIPLFSVGANTYGPSSWITQSIVALTQGGTSTSTTLTPNLITTATPTTALAITTGVTGHTIISANLTALATTGTATWMAGQWKSEVIALTGTTPNVVKPGETLYAKFLITAGSTTTSTTFTGVHKFVLSGNMLTKSSTTL